MSIPIHFPKKHGYPKEKKKEKKKTEFLLQKLATNVIPKGVGGWFQFVADFMSLSAA